MRPKLIRSTITMLWRERLAYPGRLLADVLVIIIRCGLVILLYRSVFIFRGGDIGGVNYQEAVWSMLFYFLLMSFGMRAASRQMMSDIRSGAIETFYIRPCSYLSLRFWWQGGVGLPSFLVVALTASLLMPILVGVPPHFLDLAFILPFLAIMIGGLLVTFLIYVCVGLLAFWIEDINPIYWLLDKFVMVMGGAYLPVAMLPDWIYRLSVYSPFGATNLLGQAASDTFVSKFPEWLLIQIIWISVLSILVIFLNKAAEKRLSINGG